MKNNVLEVWFEGNQLHFDVEELDKLEPRQLDLLRSGLQTAISDIDKISDVVASVNLLEINVSSAGMAVSLNKELVEEMPKGGISTLLEVFKNLMGDILTIKGIEHEVRLEKFERPLRKVPKNEVN